MDWTAVFKTTQPYQAEMVKDILEDNGIEAVILNQKDSSYNLFGEINVMVHTKNSEKAEEIIKTIDCE